MCCTSLSGCWFQFFWIDSKIYWKSKEFCPKLELLSLEFSRNCTGASLQKIPDKNLPLSFEIEAQLRKGSSALQACNCSYTPTKLHLRGQKHPTNSFFPILLEWKKYSLMARETSFQEYSTKSIYGQPTLICSYASVALFKSFFLPGALSLQSIYYLLDIIQWGWLILRKLLHLSHWFLSCCHRL